MKRTITLAFNDEELVEIEASDYASLATYRDIAWYIHKKVDEFAAYKEELEWKAEQPSGLGETFTEARKNKDMFYRDKDAWLK